MGTGGKPGITFKGKVITIGMDAVLVQAPEGAREYLKKDKEYIWNVTPVGEDKPKE